MAGTCNYRKQSTPMSEPDVKRQLDGRTLILTLNRPERLNAWTYDLGDLYFDLLDEADADPAVHVIVVTGAGRGFCSGMDAEVLTLSAAGAQRMPSKGRRMTHAMNIRKPIVGAINGPCAGFGLVQALHFDVRFAARSAVFTCAFTRRGLNAEYGTSWILPRLVGHGRAMDLIMSGRKVDSAEAERIGLVSGVLDDHELLDGVLGYARDLADWCSPIAMADAKLQVNTDWNRDLNEAEDYAKALGHAAGHRQDFAEGVASFVERRPPQFVPLGARDSQFSELSQYDAKSNDH
ncbi:Enoyl-CoA hydratase/isomerase [Burkholderia sp. H160]|nr:Enoyl-CoA hydratase/isomerase [Burkholderia sp. H160]